MEPHWSCIAEIADIVTSGRLLRPRSRESEYPSTLFVVADLAVAKRMAWERTYGEYTWTDMRELEAASVRAAVYGSGREEETFAAIKEARSRLLVSTKKVLRGRLRDLLDDVVADLGNCMLKRIAIGPEPRGLFDEMLRVYEIGGWPCGWHGPRPGGSLAAFFDEAG